MLEGAEQNGASTTKLATASPGSGARGHKTTCKLSVAYKVTQIIQWTNV